MDSTKRRGIKGKEPGGDVFSDRLYTEHPNLFGHEISEKEYKRLIKQGKIKAEC